MKEAIKEFTKFAKNYDLKVHWIMYKFHHSFRVMDFARDIALSEGLNEEDVYIASLCGLLHDIARFKQWTEYQTYEDAKSFDHGDVGYEILKSEISKYTDNEEIQNIVMQATKYHNKFSVPELDERTMFFCKLVRDADKLDILKEQGNKISQEKIILSKDALEDIYSYSLVTNDHTNTDVEHILRMLSWIFDINFKYSFNYIKEKEIFKQKFDLLKVYGETEEILKLEQFINAEIEKRC